MCALVTCGQFWSCDKDGSHTIQSAIVENLMLTETSWLHASQNQSYCDESFTVREYGFCTILLTWP